MVGSFAYVFGRSQSDQLQRAEEQARTIRTSLLEPGADVKQWPSRRADLKRLEKDRFGRFGRSRVEVRHVTAHLKPRAESVNSPTAFVP